MNTVIILFAINTLVSITSFMFCAYLSFKYMRNRDSRLSKWADIFATVGFISAVNVIGCIIYFAITKS